MSTTPALGKRRQRNQEFKIILSYILSLWSAWAIWDPDFKKKKVLIELGRNELVSIRAGSYVKTNLVPPTLMSLLFPNHVMVSLMKSSSRIQAKQYQCHAFKPLEVSFLYWTELHRFCCNNKQQTVGCWDPTQSWCMLIHRLCRVWSAEVGPPRCLCIDPRLWDMLSV